MAEDRVEFNVTVTIIKALLEEPRYKEQVARMAGRDAEEQMKRMVREAFDARVST